MADIERQRHRAKSSWYLLTGFVLGIGLSLGAAWLALTALGINPTSAAWRKFFSSYEILSSKYYTPLSQTALLNGAVSGMVQSVGDPFTDYFTPKDTKQFQSELSSSMVGIGVELVQQGQSFTIHKVIPNTPADHAGLQAGDSLEAVNEKPVAGLSYDQIRQLIVGPKGTIVVLTVKHSNQTVSEKVRVKRDDFSVPTVYTKMLPHDVGYMGITIVGGSTGTEVKKAYDTLSSNGAKALIVDLRDNPGGYLDEVVKAADIFIPSGDKLLSTVNRAGKTNVYQSSGPGTHLPVVVLINGNTASAAEVLASALHDDLHAPLVGVKSYGKGTVQETTIYSDGSGLKYTVAKWLTADGHWIHHIGIQPTEIVIYHPLKGNQLDSQLARAMQLAQQMEHA